ncbi:MAG: substrate-binding domain-containing protein [Bauldia sp.]
MSGVDDQKAWGIRNALVDGFILNLLEDVELIEPALRRKLPFVVMDIDGGPAFSSVRIDDRGGARQAAQHLVDLGHRHFAIVSVLRQMGLAPILHGPAEAHHRLVAGYPPDRERLSACAEVLAGAGIPIDDVPIVEINSNEDMAAGVSLLLDSAPETTAVISIAGDPQALAVLDQARRRGIAVPGDLSIVGFDDNPEAALADPPLTTIVQPVGEKGRVAARILFEGGPPRHVVLPVTLVVRGSTAPPRTR